MREEHKIVSLDTYEEGAVISALHEIRNREMEGQGPSDHTGDLILKIIKSPVKTQKAKDEAR